MATKMTITVPASKPASKGRVQIMHSRTHGLKSRRTQRRQEKQRARFGGWDA